MPVSLRIIATKHVVAVSNIVATLLTFSRELPCQWGGRNFCDLRARLFPEGVCLRIRWPLMANAFEYILNLAGSLQPACVSAVRRSRVTRGFCLACVVISIVFLVFLFFLIAVLALFVCWCCVLQGHDISRFGESRRQLSHILGGQLFTFVIRHFASNLGFSLVFVRCFFTSIAPLLLSCRLWQ